MMNTQSIAGLEHEPTPADLVRSGLDLICFSADKLFGGPQAGIIAGSAGKIAALKQEPIFRALRCDKLIFSALEATADMYLRSSHNGTSLGEPGGTKQRRGAALRRCRAFRFWKCCTFRSTICEHAPTK